MEGVLEVKILEETFGDEIRDIYVGWTYMNGEFGKVCEFLQTHFLNIKVYLKPLKWSNEKRIAILD